MYHGLQKKLKAHFVFLSPCVSTFRNSRIRSNKRMLLLVGGLPPGPDRLPSNLVQYYDDEKKTWKILTSECLYLRPGKVSFSFPTRT